MLRSMYSGVSGMKTHQARMDVIGNNIANVNTYGFKGSRATFRDVYYQTLKTASTATATAGGRNPSSVGYGVQLGSIDLLMGRSTFQMTDNSMDMAIDGEGFFQVQDAAGNKFYTRAGQLLFDTAGNLVDAQGNFVLGVSGNPLGRAPSNDKIQLQIPPVPPTSASVKVPINDVNYTVKAQNPVKDGNVSIQFVPGLNMTDGVKAVANVGTSGIVVTVNAKEKFASMDDFNNAVNSAISAYCMQTNGKEHPAGKFNITMDPAEKFPAEGLTGEEICSTDFKVQQGKFTGWPTDTIFGGIKPMGETGNKFSGEGTIAGTDGLTVSFDAATKEWIVKMTMQKAGSPDTVYEGRIDATRTSDGNFMLKNTAAGADAEDYVKFERPSYAALNKLAGDPTGNPPLNNTTLTDPNIGQINGIVTATAATPSKALGLSSKNMLLSGGTEGGPQGIENLSGISIGSDGVITALHPILGDITVGRLDLVTFANPSGLVQSGSSYFTTSANSGNESFAQPGLDGAGALAAGSLELSNVDLSREFADMITTQRGFQANSRLITVSDQILEELVNLKR